ncbi:MAG: TRAP-type C4-dicarboxylate transport system, small permease component [Rhodobacteraceae bacterium HLUCCA24]|nr:MAG: TRAP-type C4-dicarboxylate transport system, small permease component [Rhodobacteraceae bacterium HLUCCA24]
MRQRLNDLLATVLAAVAGVFLLFVMVITVTDVVARALNPAWRIFGVFDMVELALAWMIYVSIALAFLTRSQILVDLLDAVQSVPLRVAFRTLALALSLGALILTGVQTITPALDALDWGERTLDLGILKFWYWTAVWFGFAASVIAVLLAAPDEFREAKGRQ